MIAATDSLVLEETGIVWHCTEAGVALLGHVDDKATDEAAQALDLVDEFDDLRSAWERATEDTFDYDTYRAEVEATYRTAQMGARFA